jgi:hypothetical protein
MRNVLLIFVSYWGSRPQNGQQSGVGIRVTGKNNIENYWGTNMVVRKKAFKSVRSKE